MSDYIDREKAIEVAKHAWEKGLEPSQYIEIIPAADVRPVVRGEWKEYSGVDAVFHYCSKCKQQAFNYAEDRQVIEVLSDFCFNCGAKMDKEADHED